jgi:hypothetical protein
MHSLFPDLEADLAPQAARLAPKLQVLAEKGILFGTSSWRYKGWLGSIYSPSRYQTRNKFSNTKFENDCLIEYAQKDVGRGGGEGIIHELLNCKLFNI